MFYNQFHTRFSLYITEISAFLKLELVLNVSNFRPARLFFKKYQSHHFLLAVFAGLLPCRPKVNKKQIKRKTDVFILSLLLRIFNDRLWMLYTLSRNVPYTKNKQDFLKIIYLLIDFNCQNTCFLLLFECITASLENIKCSNEEK